MRCSLKLLYRFFGSTYIRGSSISSVCTWRSICSVRAPDILARDFPMADFVHQHLFSVTVCTWIQSRAY